MTATPPARRPGDAMTATAPVVFVVDDDSSVRDSLRRLITSVGFSVEVFPSAQGFLRARRPDVDADRRERDVVLRPQARRGRIVLPCVVMIVVVIRILIVHVHAIGAHQVVGERMGLLLQRLGHRQILKLSSVSGANRSSGVRRVFERPCSWW